MPPTYSAAWPAAWRSTGLPAYATELVLLESFVEADRIAGTCFAAANWRRVGQTTGRGRNDQGESVKDGWLLPLRPGFRQTLTGGRLA